MCFINLFFVFLGTKARGNSLSIRIDHAVIVTACVIDYGQLKNMT